MLVTEHSTKIAFQSLTALNHFRVRFPVDAMPGTSGRHGLELVDGMRRNRLSASAGLCNLRERLVSFNWYNGTPNKRGGVLVLAEVLLPSLDDFGLMEVVVDEEMIYLKIDAHTATATCPCCDQTPDVWPSTLRSASSSGAHLLRPIAFTKSAEKPDFVGQEQSRCALHQCNIISQSSYRFQNSGVTSWRLSLTFPLTKVSWPGSQKRDQMSG